MTIFNQSNGVSELDKYLQYHFEIGERLFRNDKNRSQASKIFKISTKADTSLTIDTGELQ